MQIPFLLLLLQLTLFTSVLPSYLPYPFFQTHAPEVHTKSMKYPVSFRFQIFSAEYPCRISESFFPRFHCFSWYRFHPGSRYFQMNIRVEFQGVFLTFHCFSLYIGWLTTNLDFVDIIATNLATRWILYNYSLPIDQLSFLPFHIRSYGLDILHCCQWIPLVIYLRKLTRSRLLAHKMQSFETLNSNCSTKFSLLDSALVTWVILHPILEATALLLNCGFLATSINSHFF